MNTKINLHEAMGYIVAEGGKVDYQLGEDNTIKGIHFTPSGRVEDENKRPVSLQSLCLENYYTKVDNVPKQLPYVGKIAISRKNHNVQGVVYTNHCGDLAIDGSSSYYPQGEFEKLYFIEGKDF